MVALNIATDIPSNINTVERLSAWCALVLQATAGDVTVLEVAGSAPELAASSAPFRITATANDFHFRLLSRQSLRLSNTWGTSNRLWMAAQELATASVPAEYRQV